MKEQIKTFLIVLLALAFIYVSATGKEDKTIAVLRMDGLGWYRVESYFIDEKKCVNFIDGLKQSVKFCGAYEVIPNSELHKLTLDKVY